MFKKFILKNILNKSILRKVDFLRVGDVTSTINNYQDLSFYNDLIIFQPTNAIINNGVISEITDTVGGVVKLEQSNITNRPSLNSDGFINLSDDNTTDKGLVTSETISYREVFITCNFDIGNDGNFDNTFVNFPTLLSGTDANTGALRIAGDGRTGSEDDLLTSVSIGVNGEVRVGQDQVERSTNIIPLPMSIISAAVNEFNVALIETDIITIGYNSQVSNRAWSGKLGTVIFSKTVLNNTKRLELIQKMEQNPTGNGIGLGSPFNEEFGEGFE